MCLSGQWAEGYSEYARGGGAYELYVYVPDLGNSELPPYALRADLGIIQFSGAYEYAYSARSAERKISFLALENVSNTCFWR